MRPARINLAPTGDFLATTNADRRPCLLDGIDLRSLPLTPEDAFVLSRVDGSASEDDIALATGLDPGVVKQALEKLAGLGALRYGTETPKVATPPLSPPRTSSGTFHIGPIIETRSDSSDTHPAAALYDPRELDELVDVTPELKRRILDTYYRLEQVSHYDLLGVEARADKKAIKAAYFELVNYFHPDRYFGKKLGTFKPKLERLFTRVTEAHDTLTRPAAREEYDQYLASVRRTRELDQTLADRGGHVDMVQRLEREIIAQADLEEKVRQSYPPPAPGQSLLTNSIPVIATASLPPSPSLRPPSDPDARRRALARKLGVSMPPGARVSLTPQDPQVLAAAREAAAADIKRRYEERVAELKERQVEHYVNAANAAEQAGDLVSATNALRIAASLAPEDVAMRTRVGELEKKAAAGLASGYLEQAQYEEREGRYLEAAKSYQRALRGNPSPKLMDRVASCLFLGKGDLKEAADHGKRAVQATPDDASFRVNLAKIYLEAGMKQSAVSELERAQQLAPKDDTIRDLLKRARH
jgi:curved DNA-binding protein CbpA